MSKRFKVPNYEQRDTLSGSQIKSKYLMHIYDSYMKLTHSEYNVTIFETFLP